MSNPLRIVLPSTRLAPVIIGANPRLILATVATHYGLEVADLTGTCRERYLVEARYVAMELLSRRGMSPHGIGRIVHREHTTVWGGLERVRNRVDLLAHVAALEVALRLGE